MPLEQRVIQPIYVSRGCFNLQGQPQSANQTLNIPNELECVTNGTLGNIIRQLSSLSKHAENLFSCLLEDLGSMLHRSMNLSQRIETLTHHVEHLDASNDSVASASHYNNNDPYNRQHGSSRYLPNKSSKMMMSHQKAAGGVEQFDQQVVARATIPDSLREVYETCDPPPSLEKLNPFRDDQMNGLKLYTNPNYFFELWRKEMLQDKSTKTKVAKNKQGDNIHSSGGSGGKSKRNRQQQKQQLVHQSSSETNNSYSQQLPALPLVNSQQQYHPQQIPSQSQQHYQAGGGYYQPQQQQQQQQPGQMEILTQKINPMGTTPGFTVIEGPLSGQYQAQSERPNSLELHQQQNYYHQQPQTGGNYAPGMNMGGQNNLRQQPQQSHYHGSMAPYQNQSPQQQQNTPPQQYSPSATMTPTKRQSSAQVSRPSAPPPAPPGNSSNNNSQPNSQPGTPMHKKITMVNGQEVEMRDQTGGVPLNRMVSRDSLPPPPPPPPLSSAQIPNGAVGGNMMIMNNPDIDCHDSVLPPPPPPPPPTFNGNSGNQNINSNNFTSPPPPPPPPNNGQIPSNNSNNTQYKTTAAKPTAQELQSVVLKKIEPNSHQNNHQNNSTDDVRSNLLAAIRHGITLKRVEEETRKRDENEQKLKYHDVASILARRVAMEISDSDGENEHGEHDGDSDAWDDESEC